MQHEKGYDDVGNEKTTITEKTIKNMENTR
jgi:hypothetical protein